MAKETLPVTWAKVIDHTKCIGCKARIAACPYWLLGPLTPAREVSRLPGADDTKRNQ